MIPEQIEDLRRTRDALAASEARLQRVLKGSDDGWWDWDLARNALYYSPRWWEMLGLVPDAVPADAALWRRLMHPDDQARVAAAFEQTLAQGPDSYAIEFRLLHADGHFVPVLSRGHVTRDADGQAVRVSGTNTDLTPLRQAEAEVHRRQAEQRFLLDHMVAGLIVFAPDGLVREINTRACELMGIARGQASSLQQLWSLIEVVDEHGRPVPSTGSMFAQVTATGQPVVDKVLGVRSGTRRQTLWLLASAHAQTGGDGAVQQVVVSFVDITANRSSELARLQSEVKHRMVLESMNDGVFVAQDGRFVFANAALPSMLGRQQEQVVGQPFERVIHPSSLPQWTARYLQRVGSSDEPVRQYEVLMLRGDGGAPVQVELRANRATFAGRPAVLGVVCDISQRRRAEEALQATQQFAQRTLDSLKAAVCVLDVDGHIVSSNRAWAELRASSAGAPLAPGQTAYPAMIPSLFAVEDGSAADVTTAVRAMLSGAQASYEVRLSTRAPSGRRWFNVRLTRSGAQAPLRVVVAHEDITEQVEAQHHIEHLHQRLALVLRGAGYGVWECDIATGVVVWDAQMLALHGLTPETFAGTREAVHAVVHPEDREHNRRRHENFGIRDDAPFELRIIRADDGRLRYMESASELQRASDGRPLRLIGIARDITPRKEAEAALRTSEQRWKFVLEGAGDGIWDHDVASGEISYSHQWKQMLGYGDDELGGGLGVWRDLVHAEDWPTIEAKLRALVDGSDPSGAYIADHRMRCKDGSWKWVQTRGMVVAHDQRGKPARVMGTHTDLSERKKAESARAELQSQLREAQKMEAIGTLAGGVAHDFNNVLAAILGNVTLARQDLAAGHPALAHLEQIGNAGLRARGLVQQILAFSRRQQQQLVAQPLRPRVEETLALLRVTLPAVVRVDARLADEPLHVMAEATQLQQVLMNLCTNAWHALHGSTGSIVVGLDATSFDADTPPPHGVQPGRHAHLWVADNGCGMTPEQIGRIFDPFFTTKPVGQGTGLGLSVVHGIVAAHGGAITVDSLPGQGSCFHVYLPLVAPRAPAVLTPAEPAAKGNGEQVLYIDDDELMVVTVDQLLTRAGYRVAAFIDAQEALSELRSAPERFDLVVTDYNMPNLSGIDVAREVVALRPSMPIIISSGYISDALRTDAGTLGVRALMKKERTVEELFGLVHRVLTKTV